MPLSKKRDAARKRLARAKAKGIQPSPTEIVEVLSKTERKEKLAQIITTSVPKEKITPSHVLQAIDILNKMEHSYTEQVIHTDNRQLNIYVTDDASKTMLDSILTGQRELLADAIESNPAEAEKINKKGKSLSE